MIKPKRKTKLQYALEDITKLNLECGEFRQKVSDLTSVLSSVRKENTQLELDKSNIELGYQKLAKENETLARDLSKATDEICTFHRFLRIIKATVNGVHFQGEDTNSTNGSFNSQLR